MGSNRFSKDKSRRIAELRAMIESASAYRPTNAANARSRDLLERLVALLEGKD